MREPDSRLEFYPKGKTLVTLRRGAQCDMTLVDRMAMFMLPDVLISLSFLNDQIQTLPAELKAGGQKIGQSGAANLCLGGRDVIV